MSSIAVPIKPIAEATLDDLRDAGMGFTDIVSWGSRLPEGPARENILRQLRERVHPDDAERLEAQFVQGARERDRMSDEPTTRTQEERSALHRWMRRIFGQ